MTQEAQIAGETAGETVVREPYIDHPLQMTIADDAVPGFLS